MIKNNNQSKDTRSDLEIMHDNYGHLPQPWRGLFTTLHLAVVWGIQGFITLGFFVLLMLVFMAVLNLAFL